MIFILETGNFLIYFKTFEAVYKNYISYFLFSKTFLLCVEIDLFLHASMRLINQSDAYLFCPIKPVC